MYYSKEIQEKDIKIKTCNRKRMQIGTKERMIIEYALIFKIVKHAIRSEDYRVEGIKKDGRQ